MSNRAHSAVIFAVILLAACEAPGSTFPATPGEAIGVSGAMGLWSPSGPDTCTTAIHDSYNTVGPDGLLYPTWHPPVDPITGCTFGHEHGRDPSGSALFAEVGPIPFGYANQHLFESGFGSHRNEDHVGHKVEWGNSLEMRTGNGGGAAIDVRCDVLTKLHQGTHSPDAFTNNLHEIVYHIRCTDGTGFSATLLTPIGTPGEMIVACDRDHHVPVGVATPANSPNGGGKRALPDAGCVQTQIFRPNGERPRFDSALHESWETSNSLRRADGRTLVSFDPYYQVRNPSRYFDPSLERKMGRPVDFCAMAGVAGRDRCEGVPASGVAWDSPDSPFKGTRRFVDINGNNVRNADGPNVWYTDPLGRRGQTQPFPGSLRQWVAKRDNSGLDLHGPVMKERNYDAPGVRAPN